MKKIDKKGFSVLQILIIIGLVAIVVVGRNFLINTGPKNKLDLDDYVKESQVEPPMEEVTASP